MILALLLVALLLPVPAAAEGRVSSTLRTLGHSLHTLGHPLHAARAAAAGFWQGREARKVPDMVVVSDLHLGAGPLGPGGKRSPHESFHRDQEFSDLTGFLAGRQKRAGRQMELVLAGDVMDFLKVTVDRREGQGRSRGVSLDAAPDEATAVAKVGRILSGHPQFFQSLGRLMSAGHRVVFIAGNHDQELNFPGVQRAIRARLRSLAPRSKRSQLVFEPWVHVQRRAMVEHGHRYDAINNLEYMLHPFAGEGGTRRLRSPAGNFMVTRVVNPMLDKIPGFDSLKPGLASALRMGHRVPMALRKLVQLASFIADQSGPMTPGQKELAAQAHARALEQESRALRKDLNRGRRARGLPAISKDEMGELVSRFDSLMPPTYLRQLELSGKRWQRTLKVLRSAGRWMQSGGSHSTLASGQRFALDRLKLDVHVSGHTHRPYHRQEQRGTRGPTLHLADSGSWSGPPGRQGAAKPHKLTFVEIRQRAPVTTVRLRRWDPQRRTATAYRPADNRRHKSR